MAKRPKKKNETLDVVIGTLRMHPRGFGFVVPKDPSKSPQDIFIPRHLTNSAVDGDLVEVAINPDSNWDKGPDGHILSILDRGRKHIAGIITNTQKNITAHVPILGEARPVIVKPPKDTKIEVGDRVILKVIDWGDKKNPTISEFSHKIGHINDPSTDITAAVEEFDLRGEFPSPVIKESRAFGTKVKKKDCANRLDLTHLECFTIDPETAKDFDDALSISKNSKGNFYLGVHIADVAHYVSSGSALDGEAFERCNSTYFPGKCIPMLPEELSNMLCSLREGVIRLTASVLMEFDQHGELISSEIKRSTIKSRKRYTYGEAKKILNGKLKSPHSKSLKHMVALCNLLKKKRYKRGSIDFALPELVIQIDEQGNPTGIRIEEYDITHQLVEEFMLKANEIVAKFLTEQDKPLVYRVHEEPSEENLENFYAIARALGFKLPKKPTREDIQKLFDKAKSTQYSQQLAVGFIRNLKLASYSPCNVGHFGLALEHYCHFTSPIRRYSDLVTMRLLFDEAQDRTTLDQIALKCSEKERISFRAEMNVKLLKKLRLLKTWFEEDPKRVYKAHITKIRPFGLTFEVQELFLEGSFHISELEGDYFIYEENGPMLIGKHTGKKHIIGGALSLQLQHIDLIHLESKWQLSLPPKPKRKKRKKK